MSDIELIASLNADLIRDSGHRNPMHLEQLIERMHLFLTGEYLAVIFAEDGATLGYALYRPESEHVYLRQFFVKPEFRRRGIGRMALNWLSANVWRESQRLQLDVLATNNSARAFWQSVGFKDYCVTMEMALQCNS